MMMRQQAKTINAGKVGWRLSLLGLCSLLGFSASANEDPQYRIYCFVNYDNTDYQTEIFEYTDRNGSGGVFIEDAKLKFKSYLSSRYGFDDDFMDPNAGPETVCGIFTGKEKYRQFVENHRANDRMAQRELTGWLPQ